ncbi:MAG: hypothetical protein NC212_00150 [Staphylococcus sp.]|nr:hypothetical protein [Staphylococcus sp.]
MYRKHLFEITRRYIGNWGITLYTQRGIVLIVTVLLLACNVNHANVQNGHENIDNVTSGQPAVVAQIDSVLVRRAYPITNVSAGPFCIGAVIQDTMDGFEVEKSIEIKTVSDEMAIEIPVYTYYIGNEGWVRVTPQYDAVTGYVSDNIGEIYVYSELFLTDKCIGVISSLEQFARVYPDMNIRYIGEDDIFSIGTPQLPNVQFLLGGDHYISMDHDTDSIQQGKLNIFDFEKNSHFDAVRICK